MFPEEKSWKDVRLPATVQALHRKKSTLHQLHIDKINI